MSHRKASPWNSSIFPSTAAPPLLPFICSSSLYPLALLHSSLLPSLLPSSHVLDSSPLCHILDPRIPSFTAIYLLGGCLHARRTLDRILKWSPRLDVRSYFLGATACEVPRELCHTLHCLPVLNFVFSPRTTILNFIAGRQGDILLTGNCEGGLEIYTTAPNTGEGFHKICDANFGDEEAKVVCRQAGCNTARARRISGRYCDHECTVKTRVWNTYLHSIIMIVIVTEQSIAADLF